MVIVVVGHLPPCMVLSELSPLPVPARPYCIESTLPSGCSAPGASTPGFAGIGCMGGSAGDHRVRAWRRRLRYYRPPGAYVPALGGRTVPPPPPKVWAWPHARACVWRLSIHTVPIPHYPQQLLALGVAPVHRQPAAGSRQAETDGSDKDLATAPPRIRTAQAASSRFYAPVKV